MRKTIVKLFCFVLTACLIFSALPSDKAHAASTLNVTAYGANGNDLNPDSTAIQNAIDAAVAGDTVYFPNGTYYITSSFRPKSGIIIKGQAQATTIIKFSGTEDDVMVRMTDEASSNLEISYLTFDGNSNDHAAQGFEMMNGSGFWIHHNTFKDFTKTNTFGPMAIMLHDHPGFQIPGVSNSKIEDNTFTNIGVNSAWGAAIRYDGSNNLQVLRNTISDTGRGGILCGRSTNAVIRGNKITGSGHASTPDIQLGLSIELYGGCDNSIVEDNIVDHWISLDTTNYVGIRRNTISSTEAPYTVGIELAKASYVVTTDNMINGGQSVGFSILSGNSPAADGYNYIGHNTVKFMKEWGLQFQGNDGVDVQNQYFYKNHFLNTYVNDPNAPYPGYAGHGFRTNGYTKNVTLNNNDISNNEDLGIEFNSTPGADSFSIINNTITSNSGASINQYPSAALNLEWSGNKVKGNGTDTQLTSRGFSGNPKPAADFTSVTKALVGQPVTFTNTSTDSGGSIAKSLWDFGEGIPSTATSPTYTYTTAGKYKVTLVVWDNTGRAELKEQMIFVKPNKHVVPTPTPVPTPAPTPTPTPIPTPTPAPNLATGIMPITSVPFSAPENMTDGNKNTDFFMDSYPDDNLQWAILDLGASYNIGQINLWHYYGDARSYHDVIVQLSDTADFASGVTTVFNNDSDNSAGQGLGTDPEYAETSAGKSITVNSVNARYVRFWSNGSTANASNHYVEAEVWPAL